MLFCGSLEEFPVVVLTVDEVSPVADEVSAVEAEEVLSDEADSSELLPKRSSKFALSEPDTSLLDEVLLSVGLQPQSPTKTPKAIKIASAI